MTHNNDIKRATEMALAPLSTQHAEFAQRLADGETRKDAYAAVYDRDPSKHGTETMGSRLSKKVEVEDAVGQLLDLKRATLAREIVEKHAGTAVGVVASLMVNGQERGAVRLKAAQDMLDRAGIGEAKTIKIEAIATSASLNDAQDCLSARISRVKAMEDRLNARIAASRAQREDGEHGDDNPAGSPTTASEPSTEATE